MYYVDVESNFGNSLDLDLENIQNIQKSNCSVVDHESNIMFAYNIIPYLIRKQVA